MFPKEDSHNFYVKGRFEFLVSMYSKKGLKDYRHTHHLGKAFGFIRQDTKTSKKYAYN